MAPPINWALWKLYKETIEEFLKEGYEPIGIKDGGKGSAVLAAQRALVELGHIPQGASDGGKLANWVKTQEKRKF